MAPSRWSKWLSGMRASRSCQRLGKARPSFRFFLEHLEDRLVPSTLDITGGSLTYTASAAVNNNLTIGLASGSFSFTDTGETIILTAGAAAAGWTGSGTNTVIGPAASVASNFTVNLMDGADALNVNGSIGVTGTVGLQSGQDLTLNSSVTTTGNVTLQADNIGINQAINPGTGTVILEPATQSLNMTLGTASVAGSTFGLTNADLGWITSGITQVGVTADTGNITVTNVIDATPTGTAPSRSQTLALFTSGLISDNGGVGQITVQNLALQSDNLSPSGLITAITLTNPNNAVTNVVGSDNFGLFNFVDSVDLTVGGPIAGLTGISAANGTNLTAPVINLAADVNTRIGGQLYNGAVTLAGNITLTGGFQANISFSSTVESPGTSFSLTVDNQAATLFGGAVGDDGNPLASLSILFGLVQFSANSVITTGAQTYGGDFPGIGGAIFAQGDSTLTSLGNQAISFDAEIQVSEPPTTGVITLATTAITSLNQQNTFIVSLSGPSAATELSNNSGGGFDLNNMSMELTVSQSAIGDSYTIVSSPSGGIAGTFLDLPNDLIFTSSGRSFVITYTATAVTLLDVEPLVITSPNSTTFTVGQPGSFTVTASGTGAESRTFGLSGAPSWLSLDPQTGQLTGTPPNLGAGPYAFNFLITLSNSSTQQMFTLTVNQPPEITSPNNATFVIQGGIFDVTTTGSPVPTLTVTGTLPGGVTFTQSNGRAAIFLPTSAASFGVFPITITASNGVSPDAIQQFTLTISGIPNYATTPNQRFIAQAYLDLFNQVVDTGGLAYWTGFLDNGVARSTVIFAIERSSTNQFQGEEVERIYGQYLHRLADPIGLQSGITFLNGGGTVQQLSALVLSSPEFYLTQGGGTNQGFLEAMYQDALLRPIDPNSLAIGSLYLARGGSRSQLALSVSTCREADQVLVEDAYKAFLARQADPQGLAVFTQSLVNGAIFEQVVAALMGSVEYQQDRVGA